jgi:hypothetical protein
VCFALLPWRARGLLVYATALIAGFVLFCFYLKWQPFMARMFLPLFVLASPIAGVLIEQIRPAVLQMALCLFLLNNARPFVFENWVRPLKGPRSLLRTSRDSNYFSDMTQWNEQDTYMQAADAIAGLRCATVGVDINDIQLEYPLEALLLERNRAIRFVHTGVTGPAAKYAKRDGASTPCVVLCFDCAGDPARLEAYRTSGPPGGPPRTIGRFLLFTK